MNIIKRAKLFVLELINLLTDLLVPLIEIVILLATILPIPLKAIAALKAFEEFLKQAGAKIEDFKV